MRITQKGQVTIPLEVREKYHLTPHSEIHFVEEDGRVYLEKVPETIASPSNPFHKLRGAMKSTLSTEEIMGMTRGE